MVIKKKAKKSVEKKVVEEPIANVAPEKEETPPALEPPPVDMEKGRHGFLSFDEQHKEIHAAFKKDVDILSHRLESFPNCRAKSLAITKLEECYMWIGKMVRDHQRGDA